jgi:phospholipase C
MNCPSKIGDENMGKVEKAYGSAFKTALWCIKPIKKLFIKTLCEVHIFINNQSLEILKNDGYTGAYEFYARYREILNKGVVWADQDFKSREHFYNPYTHRGLYGCRSSMDNFEKYYCHALIYWDAGDYERSMFYLGAAVHLIQDSTIPQHGNVNLLKSHRRYEQWIIEVHDDFEQYTIRRGGTYLDSPYTYIPHNSKHAIQICTRYSLIKDKTEKYTRIANHTFHMAQRTTAGCLMNFYQKIHDIHREAGSLRDEGLDCKK